MKIQTLLVSLIAILMAFNVFFLFKFNQLQKKNQYLLATVNSKYSTNTPSEIEKMKENQLYQQILEGVNVGEIEIKDFETKENIQLKDIIKSETRFFFRFKETHCEACVQSSLRILSQLRDSIPDVKISILSGYNNTRLFYAYAQTNKNLFDVYNVSELPFIAENQQEPYLFVVTPDYQMRNVFITLREDEHLTEEYLKLMTRKYAHIHSCINPGCTHNH